MTNERKLIDKKDWSYYIYKVGIDYELSIPIPSPAPGFDVTHQLNTEEQNSFLCSGVVSLEKRISDMKINYKNCKNYKLASWR